jgi:hypothetical protein
MDLFEPHKGWNLDKVKEDITKKLEPLLQHFDKLDSGQLKLNEVDVTFDIQGDIIVVKAEGSVTLKFIRPPPIQK